MFLIEKGVLRCVATARGSYGRQALFALLPFLHEQRVDAGHGADDRQHGVGGYHLQPHAAERDEPAHGRELGPVEMSTALA
jgi:hypothetical protein